MPIAVSLSSLSTFGDVSAEEDAVLEYFVTTDAVQRLEKNEVFVILGRKGAGKTALVRHFTESGHRSLSKSLNLRGYPWNLHSQRVDRGASEIEAYVSSWRYLIVIEFASLVLSKSERPQYQEVINLTNFMKDNYGGPHPKLSDILQPCCIKLSKLSFAPSILGNTLGRVDLERGGGDLQLGLELNALSEAILNSVRAIAENESLGPLMLHFDELDQGLAEFDENRSRMIIGLILAARQIRREMKESTVQFSPIIYLRTDLWDDLEFSDKNKISQGLVLKVEWNSQSLNELVNLRLMAKLGKSISWESVATDDLMRGSQSKWNHILTRSFLRPRDIIAFLNAALNFAKRRNEESCLFTNQDIVNAREIYSSYLKLELDDEILPHWSCWEEALQACSAIRTITFDRSEFDTEYNCRRTKKNQIDSEEALRLLYKFSVIGYERRSGYGGSSWAFQYTDPEVGYDNSANRFKVHLGLKEYAKLRETRQQ